MKPATIIKWLAAVAVLVGVIALILPPTRPLPTVAGDWRKQIPVKTGTPAPAASTIAVPAGALLRKPPPAPPPATMAQPSLEVVEHRAESVVERYEQPRPEVDQGERRYRQGYDWADRNEVEDERDCYRAPDDPFIAGCLAFLRNSDDDRWDRPVSRRRWGW